MTSLITRVRIIGLGVLLLATGSLFAEDSLSVSAPLNRQVIQRNSHNKASLIISGVAKDASVVIEAKVELAPGATRGKAVDWTEIVKAGAVAKDGKFTGTVPLEAGGWYTVSVRAKRGKDVIAGCKVEMVGVGDVFITAGQSNSANYGKPKQKARDSRVVYFNGIVFLPAEDPIPGGCGSGGAVWSLVGDKIAAAEQVPVCFRSTSMMWAEVLHWMPPNVGPYGLYPHLKRCVQAFGTNGVRAVLWHQGESDTLVKTSADTYCRRLGIVIDTLNKDAGYEIPWFVAQASFHPDSKDIGADKDVAKGQQLLWEKKIAHKGPVTDDLLGPEYRHDKVHFNQKGLTTHAERWFEALAAEYKWKASEVK